MVAIVLLVAGSVVALPPGGGQPAPVRLERGQEFIYHASHTQESDRPGSRLARSIDTYVLILDTGPAGAGRLHDRAAPTPSPAPKRRPRSAW